MPRIKKTKFANGPIVPIDFDSMVTAINKPGHVAVIVGKRGGGKSAQGFKIVEDLHVKFQRPIYVVGFPDEAEKMMPPYMKIIGSVTEVPNDSVVFIDEAAIHFASRDWYLKEHGWLAQLIEICRHKNLSLVFVTLNTASVDVNVLRFINTLIIKQPSLLQEELERPQLKKLIERAKDAFKTISPTEVTQAYSYVISDIHEGLVNSALPTFWSDDLSKSYKFYDVTNQADHDTPVVMGGPQQADSSDWICAACDSYHENEQEGWCDLGKDVPVMRCDAYRARVKKSLLLNGNRVRNPRAEVETITGSYDVSGGDNVIVLMGPSEVSGKNGVVKSYNKKNAIGIVTVGGKDYPFAYGEVVTTSEKKGGSLPSKTKTRMKKRRDAVPDVGKGIDDDAGSKEAVLSSPEAADDTDYSDGQEGGERKQTGQELQTEKDQGGATDAEPAASNLDEPHESTPTFPVAYAERLLNGSFVVTYGSRKYVVTGHPYIIGGHPTCVYDVRSSPVSVKKVSDTQLIADILKVCT